MRSQGTGKVVKHERLLSKAEHGTVYGPCYLGGLVEFVVGARLRTLDGRKWK